MAQGSFSAQIDAWVAETNGRVEAVFKQSAQEVIEDMQAPVGKGGNMPIDTGFLRASLQVNLSGPVPPSRDNPYTKPNSAPAWGDSEAALSIAGAEIGDTIYATYGANYACHVEYGAKGRTGRGFVRLAAMKWQAIVTRVSARLRARASR